MSESDAAASRQRKHFITKLAGRSGFANRKSGRFRRAVTTPAQQPKPLPQK
jgi:hypothetical protein